MSLWDRPRGKRKSPLDGITVRPPTPEEIAALRAAAERAERESPFQDHVSERAMNMRLDWRTPRHDSVRHM